MNHFFSYVENPAIDVFRDADFVEPHLVEDADLFQIPQESENLEQNEAIRFVKGKNISFEEIMSPTLLGERLSYKGYIRTKAECDIEPLQEAIKNMLKERLGSNVKFEIKVERDKPISYSPKRNEYVINIKVMA